MQENYHEEENMQEDKKQDVDIAVAQRDIEYIKQMLGEIKEQTVKTNGRVTAHDLKFKEYDTGIAILKWGVGILASMDVGLIMKIFNRY